MVHFLSGLIMMASLAVGLFFFRFWTTTRDRLFLWFGIAFWMMAVERCFLYVKSPEDPRAFAVYLIRLAAFLIIAWAIVDKNRKEGSR